ncbi:MAG: ZIP family metal transporter, partial [Halorientalis sp.]
MGLIENLVLVFVAGLITALATGLGALPFFFVEDFSDRWNVGLWGVASGIMVAASLFGLVDEGLGSSAGGLPTLMITGLLAGAVLVEVSDRVLDAVDVGGGTLEATEPHGDSAHASHDHDGDSAHASHDHGSGHSHAIDVEAFAEGDL